MSVTFTEPGIAVQSSDATLSDWPIPSERILVGTPKASGTVISRSEDSRILRGMWRCTVGTFTAYFGWDETITVLEGRATVQLESGQVLELAPGVVAFFGRAQESTWTVHEPFLKGFHIDSPEPLDL